MKRYGLFILAAALAAAGLSGCKGHSQNTDGKSAAASVVFSDTQCPTNLDLAQGWNSWYVVRYGIAETLYILDDTLKPQPFLAKSCTMEDETTWVIELNEGITFQNGRAVTAEAVKKSWERTAQMNPRLMEVLYIDSIETDGQTLTVHTTKPVPAFLNSLCEPLTAVVDVDCEDMEQAPVGTGPYAVESYEPQGTVTVTAYENYWGGTPKLSEASFEVIADTQALSMALQGGDTDVAVSMPAASLELFEGTDEYKVSEAAGSRGQVIFMNFENEYLQDIAVRKALSMIIDKESYANIINKGASVPATGLYPDFCDYKADQGYSYDPGEARRILAGAGYVDSNGDGYVEKDGSGTNLSLRIATYSTKAELSAFCEEMSAQAKTIGIDLKVEVYESVAGQQSSGDFDLMLISFAMMPTGDSQYFADIAFKTGGSSNYGHYSNAQVDALIEELDVEFDAGKRVTLTKQIQDMILEDAAFIVIGHSNYYYVMDSSISGLEANPSEYYLLDKATSIIRE